MSSKTILTNRRYGSSSFGDDVRQIIPAAVKAVDPFVFLDHYGPFEKEPGWEGVPMHPHAGIATITYLLEGTNRHIDSYGHDVVMQSGDMAWMTAGRGIQHAEGKHDSKNPAETSHGIQFWISLPAGDKFTEPSFSHHRATELPTVELDGASVTVLAGSFGAATSPAVGHSPAFIYDLDMRPDAEMDVPIDEGDTAAVYLISGSAAVNGENLDQYHIANFSTQGDSLTIRSGARARVIVFGGTPLNEPIVSYASFVMNSEEEIRRVITSYRNGEMQAGTRELPLASNIPGWLKHINSPKKPMIVSLPSTTT